jgi:hypothetical protein
VYQDLGPAIRRAVDDHRTRHPTVVELDDDVDVRSEPPASVDVPSSTAQRTSTRVLVGTAALIALIVLTMGASFALEGRSQSPQPTAVRSTGTSPSAVPGTRSHVVSPPGSTGDAHPPVHARCSPGARTERTTPNEHASTAAHGAPPACQGGARGSTHRPADQHGNHRGNGPPTGSGSADAKGGGNVNAKRNGAQDRSQGHATEAPAGPPATPGGPRNGPPS